MNQLTILIVDDDKTTSSILKHMLSSYADKIYNASNGLEGLRLYQTHHPDIILSAEGNIYLCPRILVFSENNRIIVPIKQNISIINF